MTTNEKGVSKERLFAHVKERPAGTGRKCRTRTAKGLFFSWEQAMPETLSFTL